METTIIKKHKNLIIFGIAAFISVLSLSYALYAHISGERDAEEVEAELEFVLPQIDWGLYLDLSPKHKNDIIKEENNYLNI